MTVNDTSNIDPNEHRSERRAEIHSNQLAFVERKSNPLLWTTVLKDLHVFQNGEQLSEMVICNNLLDCWWAVRFDNRDRPIYLPFLEVNDLGWAIIQGRAEYPAGFQEGVFKGLYSAVVPHTTGRRVCFFLHRPICTLSRKGRKETTKTTRDHFFPVLFDYVARTAYAFGVGDLSNQRIEVKIGAQSGWDRWQGPDLWKLIGHHLGWAQDVGDPGTVRVVEKSWCQVRKISLCCFGIDQRTLSSFNRRETIVECILIES